MSALSFLSPNYNWVFFSRLMSLDDFLASEAPSESEEGLNFRKSICRQIEQLAVDWLGNPTDPAMRPKLIPFGSTLLGVLTKDSDIDTVLVLPAATVSREQVFHQFVKRLSQSGISNCISAIPDAHVPVIKLVAGEDLAVDILTAHVPSDLLRQVNIHGERALLNLSARLSEELDLPSLLSLNGVRVGEIILQLVRTGSTEESASESVHASRRLKIFQSSLRFIKHWAKQRAVYSNAMGFFGGVSWAILLAKTFQLATPNDLESELSILALFFKTFSTWSWGCGNPVSLKPLPPSVAAAVARMRPTLAPHNSDEQVAVVLENNEAENNSTPADDQAAMWDPSSSEADRRALIPILTPAAPFMNSTFNALAMNVKILRDELRRAAELIGSAAWRKLSESAEKEGRWRLVLPIRLKVAADGNLKLDQRRRMFNWKGLIESKIRVMMLHLERIPGLVARPFPDPDVSESADGSLECVFQIGLALPQKRTGEVFRVDLNEAVENFLSSVSIALSARADREDLIKHSRVSIAIH